MWICSQCEVANVDGDDICTACDAKRKVPFSGIQPADVVEPFASPRDMHPGTPIRPHALEAMAATAAPYLSRRKLIHYVPYVIIFATVIFLMLSLHLRGIEEVTAPNTPIASVPSTDVPNTNSRSSSTVAQDESKNIKTTSGREQQIPNVGRALTPLPNAAERPAVQTDGKLQGDGQKENTNRQNLPSAQERPPLPSMSNESNGFSEFNDLNVVVVCNSKSSQTNVRTGPSSKQYGVVRALDNGEKLYVLNRERSPISEDVWLRVAYGRPDNVIGYVYERTVAKPNNCFGYESKSERPINISDGKNRYMLNDNIMMADIDRGIISVYYNVPRIGMQDAGVRPGTLFFRGQILAGRLKGIAFTFSEVCGPLAYSVEGGVFDGGIQLVGLSPVVDGSCRVATREKREIILSQMP